MDGGWRMAVFIAVLAAVENLFIAFIVFISHLFGIADVNIYQPITCLPNSCPIKAELGNN